MVKKLEFTFSASLGRSITITKDLSDFEDLPSEIKMPYCEAMVEAQLLEFEIKEYIAKDVVAFAKENSLDLIETLNKATLGQSFKLVVNTSQRKKEKVISQCISFVQFIKYGFTNLDTKLDFPEFFETLVHKRNTLAHDFLAKVVQESESTNIPEVIDFLAQAKDHFQTARVALAQADFLSSKFGGINPDGSSSGRFSPINPTDTE